MLRYAVMFDDAPSRDAGDTWRVLESGVSGRRNEPGMTCSQNVGDGSWYRFVNWSCIYDLES